VLELVGFKNLNEEDEDEYEEAQGAAAMPEGDLPGVAAGARKKLLKLLPMFLTRWLIISECVERVLSQYEVLGCHFNIAYNN